MYTCANLSSTVLELVFILSEHLFTQLLFQIKSGTLIKNQSNFELIK